MRFTGKMFAFVLALSMAVPVISIAEGSRNSVKAESNWKLVWSDEFDGDSLDMNTWSYEVGTGNGGWGNAELQYYTQNNVTVSDGTMKITAKKQPVGGSKYTSSRIVTKGKKEFKYGKIEAKMKLPSFKGAWPAFWMLGSNYNTATWPKCGEIDIMEAINDENKVYGTLHWFNDSTNKNGSKGGSLQVDDRTEFHVYSLVWTPKKMEWYVDDKKMYEMDVRNKDYNEVRENYFLIFNMAIGGQWPGYNIDDSAFPATMEVDYVREYQKVEEPTTKYDGPTVKATEDAVEKTSSKWENYVDTKENGYATFSAKPNAKDGSDTKIVVLGKTEWGIQQLLRDLPYHPGNTYNYSFTMTSDTDKRVYVKVAQDEDEEIYGEYIDLKAGVPYNFSKDITLPEKMDGTLDLMFGMGRCEGEPERFSPGANINLSNVSFTTTVDVPAPNQTTTAPQTTTKSGLNNNKTTQGYKKPGKTKITAAKRSRNGKSVKIKLKKVKNISGYQIKYATNKKLKKARTVTSKSVNKTIKKLKNKTYYFKARTYAIAPGASRKYGDWSKIRKVTLKK